MRHGHGLRKLNRTSSHRLAMLRNMTNSLLTHEQIQERTAEIGVQLAKDYAGKDLVVIGLLNGVYQFFFVEGVARTRASDAGLVIAATPAMTSTPKRSAAQIM